MRIKPPVAERLVNGKSLVIAPLGASGRKVGFRESCR
jgi:hypothetical protein